MGYKVPCLFVAEKPSIARTLADVLSKGQARHRSTTAQTNPCYDFELEIQSPLDSSLANGGRRMNVTVTSVRGHLMSIDFESKATKNWRRTAHRELFEASIERTVTQGLEDVAQNLRNEANRAKVLVIWTDCDREGEAIGEEIVSVCSQVNPRLIVKRARFSAANAADLWRAVNSLNDLNQREVDAVNARQEIDLRLGSVFTRFQTISLGDRISALDSKIVSFGPCQFPTLGFIVKRYEAILSFQRETFWQIKMAHSTTAAAAAANTSSNGEQPVQQNQLFFFNWARHRIYDQSLALVAFEMCARHPEGTVTEVTRKPTSKRKPLPLSTVELQIRASKWLRLDSETTMKAAESLYQRGIISYPRTETEVFADSFDLRSLLGEFRNSPEYGRFTTTLLDENGFEQPRRGSKNDEAHPPIHPIKWTADLKELPEIRVYELVCRHFLACCSRDAVGSESILKVKVAAETFTAKGLVVHERNFLDVYVYEKWGERSIPDLREGDVFTPTSLELITGETTPPELLSEADLIRLMDKNGIGTDATIQDHIKTVLEREYATKLPEKQNRFAPSNLGVALVRAYNTMGHEKAISRPELRSEMERDLVKICRGEKSREQVVRDTVAKYKEVFLDVLRKRNVLLEYVESVFMGEDGMMEGGSLMDKYDQILASQFSRCGRCSQHSMELRRCSQDGKLAMHCVNPQCERLEHMFTSLPNVQGTQLIPHAEQFACPICQYQVVGVNNGERSWFFCPSCFTNPPDNLPGVDVEDLATMPCYKCSKPECALAGAAPEDPVMRCPECRTENLVLKKRSVSDGSVGNTGGGGFYFRCKGHPACKGTSKLPKCAREIALSQPAEVCHRCSSRKLVFTLVRNKVPPGTPLVMSECPNFAHCQAQSHDFKTIIEMENLAVWGAAGGAVPPSQAPQPRLNIAAPQPQPRSSSAAPPVPARGFQRPIIHANSSAAPSSTASQSQPPRPTTMNYRQNTQQSSSSYSNHQGIHPQPVSQPPRSMYQHQQQPSSSSLMTGHGASRAMRNCRGCSQPVAERISTTAANPGRGFFKCEACSLFEWADAGNPMSEQVNSFTSRQQQHGVPAAASASIPHPPSSTTPACYHCGQTGHFPVQCPRNHQPAQPYHQPPRSLWQPQQQQQQYGMAASNIAKGGGGGGGARASDVCFKCNQPGHWSSQCPNAAAASSGVYPQQGPRGPAFSVGPRGPRGYVGSASGASSSSFAQHGSRQPPSSRPLRRCEGCRNELQPRKRVCGSCGMKVAPKKRRSNSGANGGGDDDDGPDDEFT